MSTAIAFLSGKGGSGKTTLALSMASLLCKCDAKILLVDCDLYTNGATYFYESRLIDSNKSSLSKPQSLKDLLNLDISADILPPLKIESTLDFVPSVSAISKLCFTERTTRLGPDSAAHLQKFLNWARLNYDVILFDCQAGYTELLPILLPLMDADLFVLEADSISASALRSLHLKITNSLGDAQLYQVFNKATLEEFDTYSKIDGTFYTNIGTLLFDRKIREAFSNSQIPDLENTSAKYCLDLCNICKKMLNNTTVCEKLELFSNQLLVQHLEEARKQMEKHLQSRPVRSRSLHKLLFETVVLAASAFLPLLIGSLEGGLFSLQNSSIIIVIIYMMVVFVNQAFTIKDSVHKTRNMRRKYEQKMKRIDKELKELSRNSIIS